MSDTEESNLTISAEEQERIRAAVRKTAGKRSMASIATEVGIPYGTFSPWLGGQYTGNTSRVAAAAQNWLNAEAVKVRVRAQMPTAPGFVETPTARRVLSGLETAQTEPDFVMIAGGAGVGKTTAARHYQATNPNVFILTGEPCFSTPRMLLDCLAQELDIREKYSSQTVSRAIQRRLRGSGGLIIVDEAQHLSSTSLDQMRTLFDLAEVGIALMGNETVYTRLEGHSRQAQFAQLYRRVGWRVNREKPFAEDIVLLLDAWGIDGAAERNLLTEIAKKPGALGNLTKTLKRAHMLAHGDAISDRLLRQAWANISGSRLLETA